MQAAASLVRPSFLREVARMDRQPLESKPLCVARAAVAPAADAIVWGAVEGPIATKAMSTMAALCHRRRRG
jgi:hypothetical protein